MFALVFVESTSESNYSKVSAAIQNFIALVMFVFSSHHRHVLDTDCTPSRRLGTLRIDTHEKTDLRFETSLGIRHSQRQL